MVGPVDGQGGHHPPLGGPRGTRSSSAGQTRMEPPPEWRIRLTFLRGELWKEVEGGTCLSGSDCVCKVRLLFFSCSLKDC